MAMHNDGPDGRSKKRIDARTSRQTATDKGHGCQTKPQPSVLSSVCHVHLRRLTWNFTLEFGGHHESCVTKQFGNLCRILLRHHNTKQSMRTARCRFVRRFDEVNFSDLHTGSQPHRPGPKMACQRMPVIFIIRQDTTGFFQWTASDDSAFLDTSSNQSVFGFCCAC